MSYKIHLKKDKQLATILKNETFALTIQKNIPLRLIKSIMGQQLSTKVATVIYERFLAIYKGKEPTPKMILQTPFETLRAIGLSNAKVNYVLNVAQFCLDNKITDTYLLKHTDEQIIDKLTKIKGVGKWTVEMLLMFSLGRENVFSVDDLGIQQAMCKLYNISQEDKKSMKSQMQKIAQAWQPYQTYACLHLWAWKDNKTNLS